MKERDGCAIRLVDCTLRDGGLGFFDAFRAGRAYHTFSEEFKADFVRLMDASGLDRIELGQVERPENAKPGFCLFGGMEEISALIPSGCRDFDRYCAMYNDINMPPSYIPDWRPGLCGVIRVVLRYSEQQQSIRFCDMLRQKGYHVYLQTSLAMRYSEQELSYIADAANAIGLSALYCADSYGYMGNEDVRRILGLFERRLNPEITIGYHAHNHIQMAFSNTLTALADGTVSPARSRSVDGCILGLGRGAGNLKLELIADHLIKNYGAGLRYEKIMDACELLEEAVPSDTDGFGGYSVLSMLSGIHHTAYQYPVALRYDHHMRYRDIHRALCRLDDLADEVRHRYTAEHLSLLIKHMEDFQ